jgi:hypothetical protein
LMIICSIALKGYIQKSLFQEVNKQKPNILKALNARISCQDGSPVKEQTSQPDSVRSYGLTCCMGVRFSKVTRKKLVAELTRLSGSNLH